MTRDNTLFFQIAAGLIPAFLLAGGLNQGFKIHVRGVRQRRVDFQVRAVASLFVIAIVVAEFFAIAEAVSGNLVPSAYRTVIVADVLALQTAVLGARFLYPFFPRRSGSAFITLVVAVMAAGTVGLWMLSDAAERATSRRTAALSFCVHRATLDYDEALLTAQDHFDRADQRRRALDERR